MDAIVTYDLTKEYGGRPVLESLNLQVPQGQAFACVGQRGWGKTTLIRLLSGLANPTSGECTVLGLSPTYEPQRLHAIAGTVLDSARLYAKMTLWENLRFFAGIHGFDDNDALERSSFLLHKLDIWEGRDLLVESLPTGVLRRASLARALMHRPQILLADEPPSSMDQESLEAIQALMGCVAQEEGVSLFLCCSNMEYAQLLCQNFALLKQGVLLAKGDVESLRKGAGVGYRAQLRTQEGHPAPAGFHPVGNVWEKEIETEEAMCQIIAQAVGEGIPLYEARLLRPTLREIYSAWLDGGRRKVLEPYGTAEETAPEGGASGEESAELTQESGTPEERPGAGEGSALETGSSEEEV